jgi:hypothetical protein
MIVQIVKYTTTMLIVDTLTSSTKKFKLLGKDRQSTYTFQHTHSRAPREEGANVKNKGTDTQMKPLPGFELETFAFNTMLE